MHVYWVVFEGFFEALGSYCAVCAYVSGFKDVSDVFMVLREHEVCFSSAGGFGLPAFCLHIILMFVVLLFHLGLSEFCLGYWI